MIVEKPSPKLDEVYRSSGMVSAEKGSEDHAPDQTSSDGVKLGKVSEKSRARQQAGVGKDGAGDMPEQAKGKGPAPDGTSTPQSMIYQATSTSSTSAGKRTNGPHRTMLIGLDQTPLIAKAFGLKPNEVLDLNRAVEQADGRAKAADKAKGEVGNVGAIGAGAGSGNGGEGKEQPGTQWRGNLHR